MILSLLRRRGNTDLIDRLHGEIVTAARRPSLFAGCGIADTFEGRFEMVSLHAALALRHLRGLAPPGPDIAQDLVDAVFGHFDIALRESGVGDVAVPKRMNKLAGAFLGRAAAYDAALRDQSDASLVAALARNAYGLSGGRDADGRVVALAARVRAMAASLAAVTLADVLAGSLRLDEALAHEA